MFELAPAPNVPLQQKATNEDVDTEFSLPDDIPHDSFENDEFSGGFDLEGGGYKRNFDDLDNVAEFLSDKKKFIDIYQNFLKFIKDKKIVIHNADFDIAHLNHELSLIGEKEINKNITH